MIQSLCRQRRAATFLAASALVAGSVAALTAQPAHAAQAAATATMATSSWGYLDSSAAAAVRLNPAGDAPVGTWSDATGVHTTRSYVAFDASGLRGKHILSASLATTERRAASCARRSLELIPTVPLTSRSSWNMPPAERGLAVTVETPGSPCPAGDERFDVTALVKQAMTKGATVTVLLRAPAATEGEAGTARWFAAKPALTVTYNSKPTKPTGLRTAGAPCATSAPGPTLSPDRLNGAGAVVVEAAWTDADAGDADPTYHAQVWDAAKPAKRQKYASALNDGDRDVAIQFDDAAGQLHGVTYAWRLRVSDGTDTSPWSDTCYYTVDRENPAPPIVSSSEYPSGGWETESGGPGVPGHFHFEPNGAADVVRYEYRVSTGAGSGSGTGDQWLQLEVEPGGKASMTYTPTDYGLHWVELVSVDHAGNYSDRVTYEFHVRETRPHIWSSIYPSDWGPNLAGNVGVPGRFDFSSNIKDVATYTYQLDDGPALSVAADASGRASVMITPQHRGENVLHVHNVGRDGATYAPRVYKFTVDDGPALTGDTDRSVVIGSPLNFAVTPRMPEVTHYVYWLVPSDGADVTKVTVPAGPDGSAKFSVTPTSAGWVGMRVQSGNAAGELSIARWTSVSVDSASPRVTRTGGDDLGTPANFHAKTEMRNVVEYVAWHNRDESTKQTVKPAADGSATFRFTPAKPGYNSVTVIARNADGVTTSEGGTSWTVFDSPVVTSAEFPKDRASSAEKGTFRFSPRLPGTVSYGYEINNGDTQTVAAGPDGSAVFEWVPNGSGWYYFSVWSVTADGTKSGRTQYSFRID